MPAQADQSALPFNGITNCDAVPLDAARRTALSEQMEDRPGTTPDDRADALLQIASHNIAAASDSDRACRKTISRGDAIYEKALKKQTRKVTRNAGRADSDDPSIQAVQAKLREAFIADQAARMTYLELATDDTVGKDYWARQLATANAIMLDGKNTIMLKALLEDYDWIDAHRFGQRIASHAWVLAQHADADPAFQKMVLQRMVPYLDNGGVSQRNYAYLFDRVAVNNNQPQRYGTQPEPDCNADGTLSPRTLEDPARVNERRAALNMEPMEDAMAEMASRRCRP
jgi:hypothetical protein